MLDPALLEVASTHGPSFLFAMVLLYELRDIRQARKEERENWREALENNSEALRELKEATRSTRGGPTFGDD
jgi:hypothetical protein